MTLHLESGKQYSVDDLIKDFVAKNPDKYVHVEKHGHTSDVQVDVYMQVFDDLSSAETCIRKHHENIKKDEPDDLAGFSSKDNIGFYAQYGTDHDNDYVCIHELYGKDVNMMINFDSDNDINDDE